MGKYDIPATIDYILKVSGKEALHIIAYSQGTMSSFAMLSEMPIYNDKVSLLFIFFTYLGGSPKLPWLLRMLDIFKIAPTPVQIAQPLQTG